MEKSLSGSSSRLRELMAAKNMTIQGFSDVLDVPKGTLEKYLNSPRLPGPDFLQALNSQLGVSATWVLDGVGPVTISGVSPPNEQDDQFIRIPRYDVSASAGHGDEVDGEVEIGSYSFSRSWLVKRGLKEDSLSIIEIRGDSMEPDFRSRDLILINHADRDLLDSSIYVIRYFNQIYVKRIQHRFDRMVRLVSSNKVYDPIEIPYAEAEQLEIVGKVVASMHEWG